MSNSVRSAASSRPTTQMPRSLSRDSVAGRPATRAIGTCSTAPADALATVGVTWTARWRGTSTPVHAGAVAVADDRPEVARVGDAVDGDEERRPRRGGRATRSSSSASGSGAAKAITPCGASLRARASSLRAGDVGDRHPVGVGQGDDVGDAVVGRAVVGDQLGRQPDLVDPAAPGDEQLADGLAALDLLAAEALGARAPGADRDVAARAGSGRCARRRDCARARTRGAGRRARAASSRAPLLPRSRPTRLPPVRPAGAGTAAPAPSAWRRARAPARRCCDRRRHCRPPAPPPRPPARPPPLGGRCGPALTPAPRTSTATAKQARPSPRPSAPSPSGRRPFTVTGAPTAAARRACISSRIGRQSGLLADDRAIDVADRPPVAATTSAATWRSSSIESAPANAGSVSGKCWPMSPQPGRAEQRVGDGVGDGVAVAVADEAGRARRTGTPPRTSGRSGSSPVRWTSKPWPTRISRRSSA